MPLKTPFKEGLRYPKYPKPLLSGSYLSMKSYLSSGSLSKNFSSDGNLLVASLCSSSISLDSSITPSLKFSAISLTLSIPYYCFDIFSV